MWRIAILVATLSVVDLASVDKFLGEWLPIATFPNVVTYPICDKYNISIVDANACVCGSSATPLLKFEKGVTETPARSGEMPTVIVETFDEVAPTLELKCKCGEEYRRHAVYRLINDNYYVIYEKLPQNFYGDDEPNTANLLVKKVPTTSELKRVIASIPDLKNRSTGITCDPDTNYKQ